MDEKKKTSKRRQLEVETRDNKEVELETAHPGLKEYSVQNDNFASGENSYLNEQPSDFDDREENGVAFSEELADGGERNEFASGQTGNNFGDL
ncbi:hypothetical protein SAMN05421743_102220 [Thalassobacillus cyri]|uniref:DUF4025 domain-containing protein n=1 Tax=Thalassobacillus cyri TaxID=571932 RepID=A0A1H3XPL9_9BACI|nr:hypothetical protein [Thalassobacillus cyri]SEA01447.1 hypothetical protein SAMN05421743_102220 [Thalassobacillus cyri]